MASCVMCNGNVSADEGDDIDDVLFHGELRVQQHSQIADNVNRFHYNGTNAERVVVTGKMTKH